MKAADRYDRGQLLSLCAVLLLSPALRFCPTASITAAGRAAWLSPLAALPPLLLYALFLRRFLALRREGEGLSELCARALGEKAARVFLLLSALWFSFYAGFVVRAGAERFITTIYPHSGPAVFVVVLSLLSALAALGPARSLVRTAKLVLPLLTGALALILFTALFSAKPENLFPVTFSDLPQLLRGALPTLDVLLGVTVLFGFLCAPTEVRRAGAATRLVGAVVFLSLLDAAILGSFGAELSARLTRPFFSLVRNLVFFRSVERVEALMVTLWVFPDFLLAAAALFAAQLCLRRALGKEAVWRGDAIFSLRRGRWLIPVCALLALAAALWAAPDEKSFLFLSSRLIPALNLSYALLALPFVYVVGKRTGRL